MEVFIAIEIVDQILTALQILGKVANAMSAEYETQNQARHLHSRCHNLIDLLAHYQGQCGGKLPPLQQKMFNSLLNALNDVVRSLTKLEKTFYILRVGISKKASEDITQASDLVTELTVDLTLAVNLDPFDPREIPEETFDTIELKSKALGEREIWDMRRQIAGGAAPKVSVVSKQVTVRGITILNLAMLERNQRVEVLELNSNQIDYAGAQSLATALPSTLTLLDLDGNQVGDSGASTLAAAWPAALKRVHLNINQIGDYGAKAIGSNLPSTLTVLFLQANLIGDDGAQAIGSGLPRTLVELHLDKNRFGDAGAMAIAANLPSTLTTLGISGNRIGNDGAQALAARLPMAAIVTMYFYGNKVGDAGAQALASTLPRSMVTLYLHDNQISDYWKQAVRDMWAGRNERLLV